MCTNQLPAREVVRTETERGGEWTLILVFTLILFVQIIDSRLIMSCTGTLHILRVQFHLQFITYSIKGGFDYLELLTFNLCSQEQLDLSVLCVYYNIIYLIYVYIYIYSLTPSLWYVQLVTCSSFTKSKISEIMHRQLSKGTSTPRSETMLDDTYN